MIAYRSLFENTQNAGTSCSVTLSTPKDEDGNGRILVDEPRGILCPRVRARDARFPIRASLPFSARVPGVLISLDFAAGFLALLTPH